MIYSQLERNYIIVRGNLQMMSSQEGGGELTFIMFFLFFHDVTIGKNNVKPGAVLEFQQTKK